MKKNLLVVVFVIAFTSLTSAQGFDLYNLPKNTRHVSYSRFEVHKDTLFFFVENTLTPGNYLLAKFRRLSVGATPIPPGLIPTPYIMSSYKGNLYMVLKKADEEHFLYRYNGRTFENVALPPDYEFGTFEELEVFKDHLFLGLKNKTTGVIELFRFDGASFRMVRLCSGCFLGANTSTYHNVRDEMVVYKSKLYIVGHLSFDSTRWEYPDRLLVFDGGSVRTVSESWAQWEERWDHMFVYNGLLHTGSFYGYNGRAVVPVSYHYPVVSGVDPVSMPWASPRGTGIGKTVYNNAVYGTGYLPFFNAEDAFMRRRLYSFSTDPERAREIFLPAGYFFSGDGHGDFNFFRTDQEVFNCRLFMILDNDAGYQKLAGYRDTRFVFCDLPIFWPWLRFSVFPNRGNGLFNIEVPEQAKGVAFKVMVYNDKGVLVLEKTFDSVDNIIDIQDQAKGLYTFYFDNGTFIRVLRQ
jgi:hypothetical protein